MDLEAVGNNKAFIAVMVVLIGVVIFGLWAGVVFPFVTTGDTQFKVDRVISDNGDHYVITTDRRAMIIDDAEWLAMKPGDTYRAKISTHFSGYKHVWDEHLVGG